MRFHTALLATVLLAGAAHAQVVSPLGGSTNNPPGAQPPKTSAPAATPPAAAPAATAPSATAPAGAAAAAATPAHPHHARRKLAERFAAANTTHDGKLTLAQARAGRLVAVARDFGQIDKDNRGYVTLDEIRAFQKQKREARRAAKEQAKPAQ